MWISRETALTVLKIGVSLVLNSLNNIPFLLTGISVESIGKVFPALYIALAPRGTNGLPCSLPSEGCEGLGLQCCCTAGADSRFLGKKEPFKKVNPMGVFLRPSQTTALRRQMEILVSVVLIFPPGGRCSWSRGVSLQVRESLGSSSARVGLEPALGRCGDATAELFFCQLLQQGTASRAEGWWKWEHQWQVIFSFLLWNIKAT